jgi:hypothetical protein
VKLDDEDEEPCRPPPPCPSHLEATDRRGFVHKFYCTQGRRGHEGLCWGTKPRWLYIHELKEWRNIYARSTITTRGI